MPTIRFPTVMKYYIDNQTELSVEAGTVTEAFQAVVTRYPAIKFHLLDSEGKLRRHFNVFINGVHIREHNGMDTVLRPDDKLLLMASAAGG